MREEQRIYTNIVEVESNLFDFILHFGNRDREQAQKGDFDSLVTVFMSPQHAKLLASILQNHVQMYEKNFGALPAIELHAQKVINNPKQ